MSRGGGGRGGGRGGRFGGASSFIVQSYRNLMRTDGPLGGLPDDSAGGEQAAYPPLPRRPAPPAVVKDLKFTVAAKRDLEKRFASAYGSGGGLQVAPNSSNFPAELDWLRARRRKAAEAAASQVKRARRISTVLSDAAAAAASGADADGEGADGDAAVPAAKAVGDKTEGEADEDDEDEKEEEEGEFENDEELEDNDYVDQYFDNGEGYGADEGEEGGGGDLDGESWYY